MAVRAISTVLDATLCLLLVTASVVTLVGVPHASELERDNAKRDIAERDTAETVSEVVTTSTANVTYALGDGRRRTRTTHDTLAGLLVTAAVTNASADGRPAFPVSDGFRRAVARTVTRTLDRPEVSVQVTARWTPYRGSPLGGRVTAGETPPASADVRAAVISVPSGFPSSRTAALAAARRDGYDGVARVVLERVVGGLFSPDATRTALRSEPHVADPLVARYRAVARASDTNVEIALTSGDPEQANRNVRRGMVADHEGHLRRFETPTAAAEAVSVGRATVIVRTWSS